MELIRLNIVFVEDFKKNCAFVYVFASFFVRSLLPKDEMLSGIATKSFDNTIELYSTFFKTLKMKYVNTKNLINVVLSPPT